MIGIGTLVPAYGRDYKNKATLLADFAAGKDFRCASGQYATFHDLVKIGMKSVQVRYANNRQTFVVRLDKPLTIEGQK